MNQPLISNALCPLMSLYFTNKTLNYFLLTDSLILIDSFEFASKNLLSNVLSVIMYRFALKKAIGYSVLLPVQVN